MRVTDGINATFTTQTTSPQVALTGGYYELSAACGAYNSAALAVEHLLPDGVTWLKDTTLKLTANGYVFAYLSPGSYRLIVDTGTPTDELYAALVSVPLA
jgi:hypothetical protein